MIRSPNNLYFNQAASSEDQFQQTATFFHPQPDDHQNEMRVSQLRTPPQLKHNNSTQQKPPKPSLQDTLQSSQQSSLRGSPPEMVGRPGVKLKYKAPLKKPQEIFSDNNNSLQNLNKHSVLQVNNPNRNVNQLKTIMAVRRPVAIDTKCEEYKQVPKEVKPYSPPVIQISQESIKNLSIIPQSDQINRRRSDQPAQESITPIMQHHDKLLQQLQIQKNFNTEQFLYNKQQHERKSSNKNQAVKVQQLIKCQQSTPLPQQQTFNGGVSMVHIQPHCDLQRSTQTQVQSPQQMMQQSIYNKQYNQMVYSEAKKLQKQEPSSDTDDSQQPYLQDHKYQPKILSGYQTIQRIVEPFITNKEPQVILPKIGSNSSLLKQQLLDSGLGRKSKTAQEVQRDQQQQQQQIVNLIKQDSNPSLPLINSPQSGSMYGFAASKQGKNSFLLRKPQAKMVSRIFSSKSDNN